MRLGRRAPCAFQGHKRRHRGDQSGTGSIALGTGIRPAGNTRLRRLGPAAGLAVRLRPAEHRARNALEPLPGDGDGAPRANPLSGRLIGRLKPSSLCHRNQFKALGVEPEPIPPGPAGSLPGSAPDGGTILAANKGDAERPGADGLRLVCGPR